MGVDGYDLFSKCVPRYLQGMRTAIRERLEAAYGADWWNRGVLPALSDQQRQNLAWTMRQDQRAERESYLDTTHFDKIVKWNHASVFARALPDIDEALGNLRLVESLRHQWAHGHTEGFSLSSALAGIDAMLSLLVPLERREALEIKEIQEGTTMEPAMTRDQSDGNGAHVESEETAEAWLPLWRELQSYLAVDFMVEESDKVRGGEKWVIVRARVTNTAPVGPDRPEVVFTEVRLLREDGNEVSSRPGHGGQLEPGQSISYEIELSPRALASVEFRATGEIDRRRFFKIGRSAGLPADVVTPLLHEFAARFDTLGIREPLQKAIATVRSLSGNVTLAEAGQMRKDLELCRNRIKEKMEALSRLFSDFHLNGHSRLGSQCHRVWPLLQDVSTKIEAVDTAIGQTDTAAIEEAVRSLEGLELAMLQVEQTTRQMLG